MKKNWFKKMLGIYVDDGNEKKCIPLEELSKNKLEAVIAEASKMKRQKYEHSKGPAKYGSLSRAFTISELECFLNEVENPTAFMAYSIMLFLGLRVSEAVELKVSDFNFDHNIVAIRTKKQKTEVIDFIPVPPIIKTLLKDWIKKNKVWIRKSDDYVLFSRNERRTKSHISPNWLRVEFSKARKKSKVGIIYGKSQGTGKKQYNLTMHSLRHTFGTGIYKETKDLRRTQKMLRHKDIKSTVIYTAVSMEDLQDASNILEKQFADFFERQGLTA